MSNTTYKDTELKLFKVTVNAEKYDGDGMTEYDQYEIRTADGAILRTFQDLEELFN